MMKVLVSVVVALTWAAATVQPVEAKTYTGLVNYADASHGPNYLAIRFKRGTRVRICARTCQTLVSNDYGPQKITGKLADIAIKRFSAICGYDPKNNYAEAKIRGVCRAKMTVLSKGDRSLTPRRAIPTLPPTDMEAPSEYQTASPRSGSVLDEVAGSTHSLWLYHTRRTLLVSLRGWCGLVGFARRPILVSGVSPGN